MEEATEVAIAELRVVLREQDECAPEPIDGLRRADAELREDDLHGHEVEELDAHGLGLGRRDAFLDDQTVHDAREQLARERRDLRHESVELRIRVQAERTLDQLRGDRLSFLTHTDPLNAIKGVFK